VTIDELAGAAGIARSGFYFYFESKQALLAALVDEVIGENDQEMAESTARRCGPAWPGRWPAGRSTAAGCARRSSLPTPAPRCSTSASG